MRQGRRVTRRARSTEHTLAVRYKTSARGSNWMCREKLPRCIVRTMEVPPVTIHNGLAQFHALNLYTFQGYVTPQGRLKMDSGKGQTIEGQINDQGVLRGRGLGACAYDATWIRSV